MYGAIIGDIVGSRFEWANIKTKTFELFSDGCFATDDSVLTCAVAYNLLFGRGYAAAYRRFAARYPGRGYGSGFLKWLASSDPKAYNSFGNGSAMRVSPVAWWFDTLEETLEEAKRSAAVTHNHPQGIKGACVTAGCIFLGRTGGSKDDMLDFAASMGYDVSEPVDSIRRWYRFDETCQGTVPQAVRCAYEGESYEEVIRLAVSLGGDSDTLAAIAGSVAEAFNGIPDSILEEARTYLDPYLDEVVQTFRTALTVPREQRDLTRRVNENLQEATRLVGDGRVEEAAVVVWETESACRGFKEGRGRRRRRVT